MVYTEVRTINGKKYFYRVLSVRKGEKISKKRVYLGYGLSNSELAEKEKEADKNLLFKKTEKANREIEKIKSKIVKILKKNKIKKAGIFGSYARGEQKKNSDIDIIVEPPKGIGFGFAGIDIELEEKLGKKVHLITYKYINPYIKENILKDEIRII
ncbi:hypothetical protein COV15_00175 [Candidatus Woesearchaeota archaeon CG10_big_fil_rev_8_21_14_0_10_34_12]|nr:MAG: hypothetical protein COV15_00175 [Candidatus Woesearchaeota archaeon CG10_big_fil_rev_8_21_14_0_10_34_12]